MSQDNKRTHPALARHNRNSEAAEHLRRVIEEAWSALAGYRSPALTEKQQNESLAKCWGLLTSVVFPSVDTDEEDRGRGVQCGFTVTVGKPQPAFKQIGHKEEER